MRAGGRAGIHACVHIFSFLHKISICILITESSILQHFIVKFLSKIYIFYRKAGRRVCVHACVHLIHIFSFLQKISICILRTEWSILQHFIDKFISKISIFYRNLQIWASIHQIIRKIQTNLQTIFSSKSYNIISSHSSRLLPSLRLV